MIVYAIVYKVFSSDQPRLPFPNNNFRGYRQRHAIERSAARDFETL